MPEPPAHHVHPLSAAEWRAWLEAHHEQEEGVWLVRYKTATGKPTLSYDEQVDEAMCFGWVDSTPKKIDAERSARYFAPRKVGSGWSRVNKERVQRMTEAGLMRPAGQALIDAAKADGSWTLLDAVENLEVPDDLAAALARHPGAAAYFDAFPRSAKRGILEWIVQAKREATRAKRIEETAELAARNERANSWPRAK